jgi:hypothetical protein
MGVEYDFLMVILVEFDTNIIEIGPPGLILWEMHYLMATILQNGRQWPPFWIFQVANALFGISRPKVTCMQNVVLASQCERLSHLSAPLICSKLILDWFGLTICPVYLYNMAAWCARSSGQAVCHRFGLYYNSRVSPK